jgi:hypothetical protein
MALAEDPWITENSPIPAERLHALGAISYYWNGAEIGLKIILSTIMSIPLADLWPLIHEMGDVAICAAIRENLIKPTIPKDVCERILNLLDVYEINRINRNQLVHFLPGAFKESDLGRMKGPRFDPQPIPDTINDIRRVANEIRAMSDQIGKLHMVIHGRSYTVPGSPNALRFPLLPDRLPLPERLWKPPPPNPQGRRGQPGKSPG